MVDSWAGAGRACGNGGWRSGVGGWRAASGLKMGDDDQVVRAQK